MATKRIEKDALVASTITFIQADGALNGPDPTLPNVTVDVITLDAIGGIVDPASAGTFTVWYKTDINGGFKTPGTNPVIVFGEAAGDSGADGAAVSAQFTDLPLEIKVVPDSVAGAAAYRVLIKQFG